MSEISSLRQTALHAAHVEWGARMVPFGGWSMPVQYAGILAEHHAVRQAAGLFDIGHMGEFFVSGPGAAAWLNTLLTNDIDRLSPGTGHYTLMTNEAGGVIDDLLAYRLSANEYFLVVNAARIEEDFAWMQARLPSGVVFDNRSEGMGALALQGPRSLEILTAVLGPDKVFPQRNQITMIPHGGGNVLVARTGYTGEDGFELFFPAGQSRVLWDAILNAGKDLGCVPAGLGARDTLRLEACLPLNGNDLSPTITPIEAGLKMFVSFSKTASFPGRAVLEKQVAEGPARRLAAFVMTEPGPPPRSHYPVLSGDTRIGEVTSGGPSPTLQKNIGLALIDAAHTQPGTPIQIDIRGRAVAAEIAKRPFYKRP
jgi:aminomethyltransferase